MFVNNIDPVLLHIGSFSIRYYGILYALGFVIGYFIIRHVLKRQNSDITSDEMDSLIIYLAIGAVLGARLFYCIIYNPIYYFAHIWEVLYVWQGGLSFHGGFIGATSAVYYFSRKIKKSFLRLADASVVALAFGLALGRIGNFLNQELVGRITDVDWCVKFKYDEGCRHPSQLYASAKNFIILFVLYFMSGKKLIPGTLLGTFLIIYPILRFIVEFFREPDTQLGFIFGITMGQILSILTLIAGIIFMTVLYSKKNAEKYHSAEK